MIFGGDFFMDRFSELRFFFFNSLFFFRERVKVVSIYLIFRLLRVFFLTG